MSCYICIELKFCACNEHEVNLISYVKFDSLVKFCEIFKYMSRSVLDFVVTGNVVCGFSEGILIRNSQHVLQEETLYRFE